jgi:hypothetical protein
MSEGSSIPSFFDLIYPNTDSVIESMLPLLISPINYKDTTSERDKHVWPTISLKAYNNSYLVGQQLSATAVWLGLAQSSLVMVCQIG